MASLARILSAGVAAASSITLALTFASGAVAESPDRSVSSGAAAEECTAPAGVTCVYDVPYGDGPYQTLDVYTPTGVTGEASVLLIHGGGWVAGDSRLLSAVAAYFAQNGFAAYSINYTLSTDGQGVWPLIFDDVETAAGWVSAHAADYGADGTRLAAVGDSAGAHLAALLDTAGSQDGHHMLAAVSWSGPMDLDLTYRDAGGYVRWAIEQLLGCVPGSCNGTDIAASPNSHVTRHDGALLFFNSTDEIVPPSGARAMRRALKAAHVPARLVMFKGSDAHASEYLCYHAVVLHQNDTVIDDSVRWLGKYLNGEPLIPTGIC